MRSYLKKFTTKQYAEYIYRNNEEKYNKIFEQANLSHLTKKQKIKIIRNLYSSFWIKAMKLLIRGMPVQYYSKKRKWNGEPFYFWMGWGNSARLKNLSTKNKIEIKKW